MLRSALRFAAGAALGAILLAVAGNAYHWLVVRATVPVLNIDPRLRHAEAEAVEGKMNVRGDVNEPSLPRVIIPIEQLTYNVVLLFGLFATNRNVTSRASVARFGAALLVLGVVHVIATAVSVEATYAVRIPGWSDSHYGPVEQDIWTATEYAYRLAGMFAIAFGCWWLTVTDGPSTDRTGRERPVA